MCVYGTLRYLEDCEVLKAAVAMERTVFALYSIAQYLITEILIKLCIPKLKLSAILQEPFCTYIICQISLKTKLGMTLG